MNKLFFIPIPAVIIGVVTMYKNNVSSIIWGQQLLCLLFILVISNLLVKKFKIISGDYIVYISILLLLFTFLDSGFENVHRWISIGPIRFYISSIVLPILIIGLWKKIQSDSWKLVSSIIIGISVLIALQPDASQNTAFIIPMSMLLYTKINNKYLKFIIPILLLIISVLSWLNLDNLPPVPYVENIITMVADMGIIWFILGIFSLIALPLPFIIFPPKNNKLLSLSIGIYYITVLISPIFGNFPVPLMGYGISPILGYFIALIWLINSKIYLTEKYY